MTAPDERRAQIDVLLARYGRHAPAEAAHLRALIEAERTATDRYRREAGGEQAAVRRAQQRVAAAEAAIVETEQHAASLAEQLNQYRAANRPEANAPHAT
ncbi:hypothetical protein [Streptomyces sp. 769]|uniref:hypothetical protein n=1 Tax=Streptomyces sp. 769 TaxID=1262452 RepID=UPI00057DC6A7|nr:hypothetical protein [Streptomyces sp. 769]AJC60179.1 hypothetical protein GZL_07629 [Streptomyces sp. 769]